jgi:hypothetical protein
MAFVMPNTPTATQLRHRAEYIHLADEDLESIADATARRAVWEIAISAWRQVVCQSSNDPRGRAPTLTEMSLLALSLDAHISRMHSPR